MILIQHFTHDGVSQVASPCRKYWDFSTPKPILCHFIWVFQANYCLQMQFLPIRPHLCSFKGNYIVVWIVTCQKGQSERPWRTWLWVTPPVRREGRVGESSSPSRFSPLFTNYLSHCGSFYHGFFLSTAVVTEFPKTGETLLPIDT